MLTKAERNQLARHSINLRRPLSRGELTEEVVELLCDYVRDIEEGVNFSDYDPEDKMLRLSHLADITLLFVERNEGG